MTTVNWEDIDIRLVEPLKQAGISTVEDFLEVVKVVQECKELIKKNGASDCCTTDLIKKISSLGTNRLSQKIDNQPQAEGDETSGTLSEDYIQARDYILKKNKELYERLS